ncbi:MAG TPA: hypothetical protein VII38_20150, partial [Polyangia bacterium]
RAVVAEVAWRRRAWEEVVTLYDELFGDSRGAERVENGRRLGVALERLGQPKEALAIFERALGADDAAGAAVELVWRACAEAHERAGDYPRTAETLKKAASDPRTGAPPAARAELLRRAAELLHRRAGASAEAAALYEEALALGVEERITLEALEALHAESGDAAELERTLVRKLALPPTTAHERVESLARLTELAGGDQARRTLADALTTAAAQSEDPARAAGWLKEAAELRAHVGDFSGAAEALLAAVTLAPGPALYGELETLLTDLGEWARLVALYEAQLESLDGEARRPLVEKLLRVCEGALADEPRAARFRSELGRDRAGAAQVSVAALVRTVSSEPIPAPKNDRLAAAIENAERKRAALPSDQIVAIRASHLELGQLYRQAERWDAADEELRAVLSEEPSHRVALEALCEVAERRGDFATAARASGELAHLVDDPGARAAALFREGELYLTRLGDEERAAESYLKAIDLDPAHAPTVRRLIDYFWSAADRSSVVELVASLDPAAFAAPETSAETRARAALSAALAGDRATPRLAAALGPGGALAVARSIADGLARGLTPAALTQALKLLCAGRELPLAEVRRALARLAATDPRLAPLLTQL